VVTVVVVVAVLVVVEEGVVRMVRMVLVVLAVVAVVHMVDTGNRLRTDVQAHSAPHLQQQMAHFQKLMEQRSSAQISKCN
jgi:uncharacterized membrane protein required for colicin V production